MSTSAPPPSLFVNAPDPVPRPGAPCHGRKPLPAPAVKDLPQPLTVRCPCGALFGVTVIIRSCYRKHTQLPGTYTQRDAQTGQVHAHGQMVVEDLSRTGLGFRPRGPHAIRVHEVLLVAFRLDDPQQSLIQTAVRI